MTEINLPAIYARKVNGEKTSDLANELGVTKQKLTAMFKAAGLTNSTPEETTMSETTSEKLACTKCGAEAEKLDEGMCPACVEAYLSEQTVAEELDAQEQQVTEEVVVPEMPAAVELTAPTVAEPAAKPATNEKTSWTDEEIDAAAQMKRDGKGWGEIGKFLGCSWNKSWSLVCAKHPELGGGKKKA